MTLHPRRLLALLPLPIEVPQHPDPATRSESFLAGVGLLDVRQEGGAFFFDLHVRSQGAATSEQQLIEWLTPNLPDVAVMLGYKLAEEALPALTEGAGSSEPQLALAFLNRMSRLITTGHIDVADGLGGGSAPRLDEACRASGLPTEDMSYDRLFSAWSIGRLACLDEILATNVVSLWRLWINSTLADDPLELARAEADLSCWLSRRSDDLAQVHRTGSATATA